MAGFEFTGIKIHEGQVQPGWIDLNGHVNVAYYVLAFDAAIDSTWIELGLTTEHVRESKSSTFAAECHITYEREIHLDDRFVITSQLLAFDEKRIHTYLRLYNADKGYLSATSEWMSLHVDLTRRKVAPWPENILRGIERYAARQHDEPWPQRSCEHIRVPRPLFSAPQPEGGEQS